MKARTLRKYLNLCSGKKVLVMGDAIQDVNIYCKVRGVSAETPTMVLEPLEIKDSIGGAGCVYRNFKALGAMPCPLMQEVGERPIKTRFWVGNTKMLSVDAFPKTSRRLSVEDVDRDCRSLWDAIVVADYRHGWIQDDVARYIAWRCPSSGPLFVSSQVSQEPSNHSWYKGEGTIFVMNQKEWSESAGCTPFRNAIFTYAEKGSSSYFGDKNCPAIYVAPVDTSGAGDAFLAAYALTQSLEFANLWAGLSVTVRGANPPTIEMAKKWVEEHQ